MAKFQGVVVNQEELAKRVAEKLEITKKDAHKFIDGLFDAFSEALAAGEKIAIRSKLTLEPVDTKAKTARNPQTGQPIAVPAGKKVKAKAESLLQSAVKS